MGTMATGTLTPKQKRFVAEYLIDLNATAAYQRAGYKASEEGARRNSHRLLTNADIQQAIQAGQSKVIAKSELKAIDVINELRLLAFSDLGQILDFTDTDPKLKPVNQIPEAARRVLASMKVKRHLEGSGDDARMVEVVEFKLWDKLSALDKLARHLGILVEKIDITATVRKQIVEELIDANHGPTDDPPAQSAT